MEASDSLSSTNLVNSSAFPENIDLLIDLPSESEFRKELTHSLGLSQTEKPSASLALLQLANFYEIRDCLGPAEASLLVTDIVRTVRKCLPASILACRCKNHEFALLLRGDCNDNAIPILERVQSLLASTISKAIPPELTLSCQVGLAAINQEVPSIEALYARARLNIRERYANSMSQGYRETIDSKSMVLHIRRVLRQDNLNLNYQPIVNLDCNHFQQFEVRADFRNSKGNMPTHLVFELAAQEAMGERIDRYVISKFLNEHSKVELSNILFAVNVSLDSLINPQFLDWLNKTIEISQLCPQQLMLQISEIDILIAQHHLQHFSKSLYQMQVKLGIRDFGCTADAFKYLPMLRLYQAKLDSSLLENIETLAGQRKHLRQISMSLQSHGIRPVACMLEGTNLLPILWEIGIRDFQGHCLQAPSPYPQFDFPIEQSLDC